MIHNRSISTAMPSPKSLFSSYLNAREISHPTSHMLQTCYSRILLRCFERHAGCLACRRRSVLALLSAGTARGMHGPGSLRSGIDRQARERVVRMWKE